MSHKSNGPRQGFAMYPQATNLTCCSSVKRPALTCSGPLPNQVLLMGKEEEALGAQHVQAVLLVHCVPQASRVEGAVSPAPHKAMSVSLTLRCARSGWRSEPALHHTLLCDRHPE